MRAHRNRMPGMPEHCQIIAAVCSFYRCLVNLLINKLYRNCLCTVYNMIVGCDQQFFIILSYNKSGTGTGRILSLILLSKQVIIVRTL